MINLGVLGSTNGTDLKAIIKAINQKVITAKIAVVISNKSSANILKKAKTHNIPSYFISTTNKTRSSYDFEITKLLIKYKVDLILLIGFMRILSSDFCKKWNKKVINVHPSLLPKYAGGIDTNIHEEVLKNKEIETGCTIHYVTEKVDNGPIIIQKKCKIKNNDTITTLKKKVQELEGEAFIEVIKMLS